DASILFIHFNIRYFTGFVINQSTETILIVEQNGEVTYLVPRLDLYRAKQDSWIENIFSFWEDTPDYLAPLKKFIKQDWKKIGMEINDVSYAHLSYIKKIYTKEVVAIDLEIAKQRAVKSDKEIRLIEKSANIASITMNETKKYILDTPGITEREATGYAKYIMEKYGAENY